MKWVARLYGAPTVCQAPYLALGRGQEDKLANCLGSQGAYKREFRGQRFPLVGRCWMCGTFDQPLGFFSLAS